MKQVALKGRQDQTMANTPTLKVDIAKNKAKTLSDYLAADAGHKIPATRPETQKTQQWMATQTWV